MKAQTLFRCHPLLSSERVILVDLPQLLQHITAFLGKVLGHLDKLAPSMRDAISQDHLKFLGRIARKGVAHLDRWTQLRGPLRQHLCQVLPGMLAAREKQCDPPSFARRHDPGSEYPRCVPTSPPRTPRSAIVPASSSESSSWCRRYAPLPPAPPVGSVPDRRVSAPQWSPSRSPIASPPVAVSPGTLVVVRGGGMEVCSHTSAARSCSRWSHRISLLPPFREPSP